MRFPRIRLLGLMLLLNLVSLAPQHVLAQRSVDRRYRYERLMAIVPMVGAGTAVDPRRPMFVSDTGGEGRFLEVQYVLSDDGQYALTEFVAEHPGLFRQILESRDGRVKAFRRGQAKREDVEREFRQHKARFSMDEFEGRRP